MATDFAAEGLHKPILKAPAMGRRRTVYVANNASFGDFIMSEQVRDPVADVAEAIAEQAKDFSPESSRGGTQEGRRMRDQFVVEREAGSITVGSRHRNRRVLVIVSNNARSAAPNEFGTRKNKRHRMLGRAGAMFGDFKPEGGPGA